jgi:endonuclease/exonuclease/phosphatase family metal-dependent hydrolase
VKEIGGSVRKRRLDYCFVGSMLAPRVRSVAVNNAEIASDHHPLFVDIDLDDPASPIATPA